MAQATVDGDSKAAAKALKYQPKTYEVSQELKEMIPQVCCGCGVALQSSEKDKQGFYVVPTKVKQAFSEGILSGGPQGPSMEQDDLEFDNEEPIESQTLSLEDSTRIIDPYSAEHSDEMESLFADVLGKLDDGDLSEEIRLDSYKSMHVEQTPADPLTKMMQITCARCHKLTHEGRVNSLTAELELPPFDLADAVGTKIARRTARNAVVLVVVDVADFDGSLPREALRALLPEGKADHLPFKFVFAVNKMDTLPRYASHIRIQDWVRRRAKQGGLPRPESVHLVSSVRNIGIKKLSRDLVELVGIQGDLWVVGAQNAGKSSLINALKKEAGTLECTAPLTTAALPGTTLGMIPVEGIPLMAKSRCYDTPGVPHPYQLTSRLGGEDVKLLLARQKAMKPRTYRVPSNNTIFIGGLTRIDINHIPAGPTVYATVWASDLLPLHVGKTDTAHERWLRFVGNKLYPPSGSEEKVQELGPLIPQKVSLEGQSWQRSSADVCIAGLGWVSFGVKGVVDLTVWTHAGVAVTTREAMIPDFAKKFETPGWSENTKTLFKNLDGSGGKPDARSGGTGQKSKLKGAKNGTKRR